MHAIALAAAAAQESLLPHIKLNITAPNEFSQLAFCRKHEHIIPNHLLDCKLDIED
jgi:hypothetical protein